MTSERDLVARLLERHGTTYAEEAGIPLADEPAPLWQLLVLTLLLSARIRSATAVAATRELLAAGCTTPEATRGLSRGRIVVALGRGGYRRYDERTANQLAELARVVLDEHGGDLRRMHEACADVPALEAALQRFTGIGPAGAAIYVREVQGVRPEVAPYVDGLAARGAARLGLPTAPAALAALAARVDPAPTALPRLVAACVRAARSEAVVEDVRAG
ncbi:endonuclease [Nocardioides marmotae]|uniref:Endonuclease n=1 Tax=Nocardioides marmotae TaxID=2663857 RepID=A0A6I3JAD0_9ACTN|nr:endonuclease [Nocardioides marmotae]MCR6030361.1 endonuclease [Gordonia jinghuaiqii]MBC9734356.1 endonuclease [Nocardioides marmotae]MTB85455.1 endonuclease [Nocardioides marmotae]MTB93995.1 endonuclease [Nocardioides marmotae]QKE00310.1 endonuclease [Nocardioides marmotae]